MVPTLDEEPAAPETHESLPTVRDALIGLVLGVGLLYPGCGASLQLAQGPDEVEIVFGAGPDEKYWTCAYAGGELKDLTFD